MLKEKEIKLKKHVVSSVILSLFMLASALTAIPVTQASHDYNYGFSSNLYTTNWLQYSTNAQATATAFSNIDNLFTQQRIWIPSTGWVYFYGEIADWGSSATPTSVYNRIAHDNTVHSASSVVLYVGHGGPSGFYVHTNYPNDQNTTPDLVSFSTIQSYTQSSPQHHLSFMWVCNGKTSNNQGSATAWNPMAMNNQAAYGPYTWIGFSNASPWLIETISPGNTYQHWLTFFYYHTLTNGYSVTKALDEASKTAGMANFASTPLAKGTYQTYWPYSSAGYYSGQMHVVGNPSSTYI
ncbi:MAG: hypothetical protein FWB84_07340 [Candidatus Bathyarchaeota archaeon]|uniref:hypothetical protein n=1 Tax=Candidatus Bathycorpusculum sp. TaxID=2994959 RepID=UPI0028232CA5|nr:hypothetical protein [Candidatus Termiticorpusculum sp.]MCL2257312.1 hypothetical protein [Candidatus Termiticorpusculum sp.]MCL2291469.1 hypothetical protein [Candidatus Termiticorpusculum sp.]